MALSKPGQTVLLCLLLGGLTSLTFWPVLKCEFVNLDDPPYVTQNAYVIGGLTVRNVVWAFSTGYFGNWHPITWMSHMLDVTIFGLNPAYHHLTSLLLHICNTCLLFWFLYQATQRTWPSALVAALFAVHPLHVESVAWISERKDVLSTFFALLSLLAYLKYVKRKSKIHPATAGPKSETKLTSESSVFFYGLALIFFALGLMSKAMIVTLPFLMLLLDFWPLGRLQLSTFNLQPSTPTLQHSNTPALRLLLEKLPFFFLALLFTVISSKTLAQSSPIRFQVSLANTAANVCVSYMRYIGKTFWPVDLTAFYPRSAMLPSWQAVVSSAAALLALSLIAIWLLRRRPYVAIGWFWFLGTLVPVIGLPFGDHAMADRYTYVPLIGLFIILAWSAADLKSHFGRLSDALTNSVLAGTAVVLVVTLAAVSKHQLKYWRTGQDLLEHVLAVTGDSAMAHNNLGVLLMARRDWPGAEKHFTTALHLEPTFPEPRINLASVLAQEGKPEEATPMLNGLNLELQIRARLQLADILLKRNMTNEAVKQYSDALNLSPTNAAVRESLGLLLAEQGKISEAAEQFDTLVRLRPDGPSHYHLALSLLIQGKTEEAIAHYKEAIRLKPDWPEPLNDLAWLLATYPRVDLRNGPEAVELAERACKLTHYKEARFLGTLDAGYAEAGRFPEAISTAERAKNLALTANDKTIADLADERLKLYRTGVPFHQQQ